MHDISGGRFPLMALVFWVGLCVLVGLISGLLTKAEISRWYAGLRKPSFNPPNWIFGPVWTALYILMGVAAWMIWQVPRSQLRTYALIWFAIQLGLNFLWSLIFFRWHAIAGALGEISILWLAILATIVLFWEVRPLAGELMLPYLAWVSFASVLNLGILRLNQNR
ncbi:MAG TPA: TspO/MBR family protein [Acidobacteriaceae bacterium]|nr:TspO/MBR family protein [Acidobacteriaceae bacterium]